MLIQLRNVDTERLSFRSIDIDEVTKDDRGMPIEFRIFALGEIRTEKGTDIFDDTSVDLLQQQIEQMGRRFPFDYDHLSLNKNASAEDRRAAGFHELEIRGKELWAVNCTWTNEGVKRIGKEAGEEPEFKYFSPAFYKDENGRIVRYINCAVTNNPATWGVAALRSNTVTEGKTKMTLEQMLKMLGLRAEDLEGKSEEEVMESLNNAIKARAAGEPDDSGEPKQNSEGEEDPPQSDAVPATKSDDEAARSLANKKPAQTRNTDGAPTTLTKGINAKDLEKILQSYGIKKPQAAVRSATPTGGVGASKAIYGDFEPVTNPEFRSMAGLPAELPTRKSIPDNVLWDGENEQFVILRNMGDVRRHREKRNMINNLRRG